MKGKVFPARDFMAGVASAVAGFTIVPRVTFSEARG